GYGCAVLPLSAQPAPLLPEERVAIVRAVPKRQREFALGRTVLRMAIGEAGHDLPPTRPIARRPDRQPDLPGGIHASLSHGGDYCIAIAAPPEGASVGFDLAPRDRARPAGLTEAIRPFRLHTPAARLLGFGAKAAMF